MHVLTITSPEYPNGYTHMVHSVGAARAMKTRFGPKARVEGVVYEFVPRKSGMEPRVVDRYEL